MLKKAEFLASVAKALAKKQSEKEAILSQNAEAHSSDSSDVKLLSPVETKVKPLKIPMKPKLIGPDDSRIGNERSLGVPGAGLRINQSSTTKSGEQGSHRTGRSSERRNVNFDNVVKRSKSCGGDVKEVRRTSLDMENIASVKSRIETYLSSTAQVVAPPTLAEQPLKQGTNTLNVKQPKSILVNRSEGASAKTAKTPKLIHDGEGGSKNLKIYAQSATDISAGEEDSYCSIREPNKLRFSNQQDNFLQVPKQADREHGMAIGGIRKSKSFATPGQFECAMDDRQIDEKRRTMMAFFTSQTQSVLHSPNSHSIPKSMRKISQPAMHIQSTGAGSIDVQLRSTDNARVNVSSSTTNTKRSSVASISDEIIADEDLKDVDAVFESLLTSTFSESESSSSIRGPKSGYNI